MTHILIVDDESSIRESLQGILEDEGYKTSVSPSGEHCLELLRKTSFDLILLDVWLTGIVGPRDDRNGRARHQARRLRLRGKAVIA